MKGRRVGYVLPERVMRAVYSRPALDDRDINAMHANKFETSSATHGTPARFVMPRNLGAFPVRAMCRSVRLET